LNPNCRTEPHFPQPKWQCEMSV